MRKLICISVITLLLVSVTSFAQKISMPADSISILLCKKWEVDHAMMGNMKIGKLPNAPEINYEFYKDKTFVMASNDQNDKTKGAWAYDAKKKIINLTVNGKTKTSIISLKEGELIMLADTSEATPDDPMQIKLVYKIRKI